MVIKSGLFSGGVLLTILLLGGCEVGPDFTPPDDISPASWFRDETKPAPPSNAVEGQSLDPAWWNVLHDPMLNDLVNQLMIQNLDLQAAATRIEQSRAQRGIVASDLYPQLAGTAAYDREKLSNTGIISIESGSANGGGGGGGGGGGTGGGGAGIPAASTTQPFNLYQYGVNLSWEIDLWGHVRRGIEAADATAQASIEDRRGMIISSIAELVRDYVQLRGLQANIEATQKDLDDANRVADLVRNRAEVGLSSRLDLANAQAQAASTAAQLPQLEQQKTQLMNAIALLLAKPPGALDGDLNIAHPIPPTPPEVPIGVASELAKRRPDIREAEAKLHSATAQIGVAEAEFFPEIDLMGNGMMQSLSLSDLTAWSSHTYSFGPTVTLPIFEGGKLVSNLDMQNAAQREAAIEYRKTVLNAFHEVDNALTAFRNEQVRHAALTTAVEEDQKALDLALSLYKQGLGTFVNVLTDEENLLAADQQRINSTTTVTVDMTQLYKALGGGWERDDVKLVKTTPPIPHPDALTPTTP